MSEILEIPITDLTNPHWCRPAPEAASIIGDVTVSPLIVPRIEPGTDSNLLEFERGGNTEEGMNGNSRSRNW